MFKKQILIKLLSFILMIFCAQAFLTWFNINLDKKNHVKALSWVVASKKIVIDPGHGGIFPGKVSRNNIAEKDINLKIAKYLATFLNESGAMVYLTRDDDSDLVGENSSCSFLEKQRKDLRERVNIAQIFKADIFISIHCNSIASSKWRGAQTFYEAENVESEALGKSIQEELIKQLKNTKRKALIRKDTFIFNNLEIPAVIIECGFISNEAEEKLLSTDKYQEKLAFAIYSGIVKHLANDNEKVNK